MITNSQIGTNGRFGNQLFQYSSLYGIAKKNNYDYGIPYSRKNINEHLNLHLPECFSNLTAKDSSNIQFKYNIKDDNWIFDPNFFNIPDDTDLWGYFQSEKYFIHCKEDIIQQFEFNKDIQIKANNYFINGSELISLHIRLGDYLFAQQNFPVCSIEYYNDALEKMPPELDICIFTDDVNMAKQIFKGQFKSRKILYIDSKDKFVDMCLMTRCDRHIIANSSFSWWGAWLAKSKKVIAPKQWFGFASSLREKHYDIYCNGWEII